MGLQMDPLKEKDTSAWISLGIFILLCSLLFYPTYTNLVPVHELLADDIFTNTGGRNQVVELVEKLDTALMVLRGFFTQLVPEDEGNTLNKRLNRVTCETMILSLSLSISLTTN